MPADPKKNNPVREGQQDSSLRTEKKDEQGRSYPFPDEGQEQQAHQPEFIDPDPEFSNNDPGKEKSRKQPSGKEKD